MGTLAYLSLGSNLGDRIGYVQQAIHCLTDHPHISLLGSSSFYETEPLPEPSSEGCLEHIGHQKTNSQHQETVNSNNQTAEQPWYVNVAVAIETELPPHELLGVCQSIEKQLKRERDPKRPLGPRTIDIDILFYGEQIIEAPNLSIPHPRLHQRACVLVPLLEICPSWIHPTYQQTISELHQGLESPEEVCLYGTRHLFKG